MPLSGNLWHHDKHKCYLFGSTRRAKSIETLFKMLVILTSKQIDYFDITVGFSSSLLLQRNLHKACEVVNMKCQSTGDNFFSDTVWCRKFLLKLDYA